MKQLEGLIVKIFFILHRVGFDSHVLRFAARLINDYPEHEFRYFIIRYFLCDDTIGIFELGERNSGFKVGSATLYRLYSTYCVNISTVVRPPQYVPYLLIVQLNWGILRSKSVKE